MLRGRRLNPGSFNMCVHRAISVLSSECQQPSTTACSTSSVLKSSHTPSKERKKFRWVNKRGQGFRVVVAGTYIASVGSEEEGAVWADRVHYVLGAVQQLHFNFPERDYQSDPWVQRLCGAAGVKALGVAVRQLLQERRGSYRGVVPEPKSSSYRAVIYVEGRYHHLGAFQSQEEAARCFDLAALHLRGPRALLNFPGLLVQYQRSLEAYRSTHAAGQFLQEFKRQYRRRNLAVVTGE